MKLRAQLSCKMQHSWIVEYKKIQTWFAGETKIKEAASPDKTCLVRTLLGTSNEHFTDVLPETVLHCLEQKKMSSHLNNNETEKQITKKKKKKITQTVPDCASCFGNQELIFNSIYF